MDDDLQLFACSLCDVTTLTRASLLWHNRCCHLQPSTAYQDSTVSSKEEFGEKCAVAKDDCFLCQFSDGRPSRQKRHMLCHWMSKSNVIFNGITCFLCKKNHNQSNTASANIHHFHCFICDKTIQRRIDFEKHLCKCWKEFGYPAIIEHARQNTFSEVKNSEIRGSTDNSPKQCNEHMPTIQHTQTKRSQVQSEDILEPKWNQNKKETEEVKEPKKTVRNIQEIISCDICQGKIQRCSLNRHLRTKHNTDTTIYGICVDSASALYMVRKTTKGLNFPCHVQKQACGTENALRCELNDCISAAEVASRSGYQSFECQHLERASKSLPEPSPLCLEDDSLMLLSSTGKYKLFTDSSVKEAIKLRDNATRSHCQPVIQFPCQPRDRFQHFSVYEGHVHNYCRLKRCVVSVNTCDHTLDCSCCRRKQSCLHKCMVLWFLMQKGSGELPIFSDVAQDDETNIPDFEDENVSLPLGISKVVYPPDDEDLVKRMTSYLLQKKKCPHPLPWLQNNMCLSDPKNGQHPVTGSTEHYCLFDRLHENNSSVTGTAAAQESVSNHTSSSTSASTSADQPKDSSTETSSKQPSPSHISQSHTKDSYTYTVEADELSVIDLTGPEASELPDDTSYRSVWIPSLYLTQVELGILNRKECLTDTVIEAGQILLKKQFSYICGLQPPCLSQSPYGFDVQPGEFVQIIHLHFHWLTLSTIGCQPSEINVYDSMQSNNYSQVLKKTAASLMLSKENQIKFNIINVTQQKDGTSCGVYALAFASALCLKIDPSELIFDHARMYCDLKKCLEIGQMGLIGADRNRRKIVKVIRSFTTKIFCTCRCPDDGNLMMECIACKEWFHEECVGHIPLGNFICRLCRKRRVDAKEDNAGLSRLRETTHHTLLYKAKSS